jgi:hypothetical protein
MLNDNSFTSDQSLCGLVNFLVTFDIFINMLHRAHLKSVRNLTMDFNFLLQRYFCNEMIFY